MDKLIEYSLTGYMAKDRKKRRIHFVQKNKFIHLKDIFEEGELVEETTCKDFLQVQKE